MFKHTHFKKMCVCVRTYLHMNMYVQSYMIMPQISHIEAAALYAEEIIIFA